MSEFAASFSSLEAKAIERAITERRSVRAFLDRPVARAVVEHMLACAARAPSGTNMQPWRARVLTGDAKERFSQFILAQTAVGQAKDKSAAQEAEYKYYPDAFFEPYLSRRRKVGWDMYGLLGIAKGDTAAMARQSSENYTFFNAPVGMIFTIDRRLEIGSWLDYGYFLEALSLAARAQGLETCSQAAFAYRRDAVREALALEEHEMIVCGLALGYPDWSAKINALRTERAPVEDFATFHGF